MFSNYTDLAKMAGKQTEAFLLERLNASSVSIANIVLVLVVVVVGSVP